MEVVFQTDRGKVRQHNEDNGGGFLNDHSQLLAVVADGMGGHQAGDVASQMTIDQLESHWSNVSDLGENPEKTELWLKETIQDINHSIFLYSNENQECQGMGTTLVLAVCQNEYVTVANIGDSRCYLLNHKGLTQITDDHSLVNELVKSGQISKEDAEHHPRKNVLMRALGTEGNVKVDVKTLIWEQGDMLLLCSDGLTNKVTDQELAETLIKETSLEEKAFHLIGKANESGGDDNITVVLVRYPVDEEKK